MYHYRGFYFCLYFCFLYSHESLQSQHSEYPVIAHSHNDYKQNIPLFTALENGFTSIEIDVFEYQGQIVVCHDEEDVADAPTIEELYLIPLFLSGAVRTPLILLIDLKEEDDQLLAELEESFNPYQSYLQSINGDKDHGKIQIILSGEVPKDKLLKTEAYPLFYIDGRMEDLEKTDPFGKIAMISGKFSDFTGWSGKVEPKMTEVQKLMNTINLVKEKDIPLRFWATPDKPKVWEFLLTHGVEIIGVDDINGFIAFLSERN